MRTRDELLELIKSNRINESKLTDDELRKINADDFENVMDFIKFTHNNSEFFLARAKKCEKNLKKVFDL